MSIRKVLLSRLMGSTRSWRLGLRLCEQSLRSGNMLWSTWLSFAKTLANKVSSSSATRSATAGPPLAGGPYIFYQSQAPHGAVTAEAVFTAKAVTDTDSKTTPENVRIRTNQCTCTPIHRINQTTLVWSPLVMLGQKRKLIIRQPRAHTVRYQDNGKGA